jgi:hypothetical protein
MFGTNHVTMRTWYVIRARWITVRSAYINGIYLVSTSCPFGLQLLSVAFDSIISYRRNAEDTVGRRKTRCVSHSVGCPVKRTRSLRHVVAGTVTRRQQTRERAVTATYVVAVRSGWTARAAPRTASRRAGKRVPAERDDIWWWHPARTCTSIIIIIIISRGRSSISYTLKYVLTRACCYSVFLFPFLDQPPIPPHKSLHRLWHPMRSLQCIIFSSLLSPPERYNFQRF